MRWKGVQEGLADDGSLPDAAILESFFSACYQASMLREEERPVTFRAILAAPTLFPEDGRPPESLLRLAFFHSCSFDATELRRLSVATDTQRTMIGVRADETGGLLIWGLVSSGTRWLRDVQGGRQAAAPLPPVPVIHVDAPASMAVYKGHELVAKLHRGEMSGSRADSYASAWLPRQFNVFRDELMARHQSAANQAREHSGEEWAPLEPRLLKRISERMMKRVNAILRSARHGGTIVFVPVDDAEALCTEDPYIDLKYRFEGGRPRCSFPKLVVDILNRLAQLYGVGQRRSEPIGWGEFEAAIDGELEVLDEALFEMAHLIAGLASADGAVVMTKQHDLLGFGGMISGTLPNVRVVARALDLEGDEVIEEGTDNVGARHRSAYRLVGALPGAVVIVISQDGGARFVCQKDGRVTYWEQD